MSTPMTLAELVAAFREDTDDYGDANGKGQLWKDATVTRFLNEAQAEAALRARLIFDKSITLDATPGTIDYPFAALFEITRMEIWGIVTPGNPLADPVVLPVYTSHGCPITSISQDAMDRCYPCWRDDCRPPEFFIQNDTTLTFPSKFTTAFQARMNGYRLPTVKLASADDTPEINGIHHIYLVEWAKHRAYSKPDSEGFNPQKSADALARFEDYFGYRPSANQNERNESDRPHHTEAYW